MHPAQQYIATTHLCRAGILKDSNTGIKLQVWSDQAGIEGVVGISKHGCMKDQNIGIDRCRAVNPGTVTRRAERAG